MSVRGGESRGVGLGRMRLIAMREFRERARQRAYLIALVVGMVFAAAAVVAPALIGDDSGASGTDDVALVVQGAASDVTDQRRALTEAASQGRGVRVRFEVRRDAEALRTAIRDGDVTVGLIVSGTPVDPQVKVVTREGGSPLADRAAEVVDRAAVISRLQAGSGDVDVPRTVGPVTTSAEVVAGTGPTGATTAVVSVLGLLLYIAGIMLTTAYATGVVSDRTNHVTERLLTAARPSEHLGGKLIGVGASGLLQFAAWIAAALLADLVVSSTGGGGSALDEAPTELLVYFPIALISTYVIYSAAATVLVLPVRKAEDVGGAIGPAVMLQVVGFIAATTIVTPGATVSGTIQVLSLVPFFSPMLMLARLAGGDVATWELIVSVAGPLVLATLLLKVAAPAYARYSIDAPGGKGLKAAVGALRGR